MRRWFVSLCLIGLSSGVYAADYNGPYLRGPMRPEVGSYSRWEGAYVGGQVGYGFGQMSFYDSFNSANIFDPTNTFIAPLGNVSSWATFDSQRPSALNYGGFIGYNTEWEGAILGVEFNYNHIDLSAESADSQCYSTANSPPCSASIVLGDTNTYDVTVNATTSARLTDYATLRGRAGFAYGEFMPYAFAGLAIGRVETVQTATASGVPTGLGSAFVHTESVSTTGYPLGYTAGVGIDVSLWWNVFMRAEYEFVHLTHVTNIDVDLNTVRFGAGVRF